MSKEIETGGSAFPFEAVTQRIDGRINKWTNCGGMTLRDYFAAKAIQALLSKQTWNQSGPDMFARDAYTIADAMLEARKS